MTETPLRPNAIGSALSRVDAMAKVTGTARYAYEQRTSDVAYVFPVQSTIARGRIVRMDTAAAEALPGVLTVLTPDNTPTLADTDNAELAVLQSPDVAYRGQFIGAVIAETAEIARHAADLVRVDYEQAPHDVELRADRPDLYKPDKVNPNFATDTEQGDVPGALADSAITVDRTYSTALYHNNPMEPHATAAGWQDGRLVVHDSTQSVHGVRETLASVLGLATDRVRVIAPYVGGGFGAKGEVHAHVVLAALAATAVAERPVKLALTRQQMFAVVGYRTPTIQHVRLGADADGRLNAIAMDVVEQTARLREFAEQTGVPARMMYRADHRRTTHRLAALDVPVPSWMRAPGECPGMFGPEVAMDELAEACGVDPVELRVRNEPEVDPETGRPYSSRNLVACLREGARRFDWDRRDPTPRARREDGWLIGTGVASSTYPARRMPGSVAAVRFTADGRYRVEIGAADIGTGAWTALTQIAADALGVPVGQVELGIGDTAYPKATVAGGSTGTASWGAAVTEAARVFREKFGDRPSAGDQAEGGTPDNPAAERFAMHSFGAQFAEVRVHEDTGEVRVSRLLGVFACGRIINPRTARSQFIGGMTMGLSMALHEHSELDPRFGHVINHDLAEYHVAAHADVTDIEAHWLDEHDPYVNPMGSKGVGEIGIVGTAAAVANAAYHATGVRIRELPITLDRFLGEW
jgi:xanthine dehydrogenase YagR molybdenum-binding subunit